MRTLIGAVGFVGAGVGCVQGDLPAESNLDRLRVLAARATPAEVGPGDAVALESLTYAPAPLEVGVVWEVCVALECPSVERREDPWTVLEATSADPGVVGLEPDAPPRFVVPPALLDNLDPATLEEGTFLRFGLTAAAWPDALSDDLEWATKDLPVSTSAAPNQNPQLSTIVVGGQAVAPGTPIGVPDRQVELEVSDVDALAERYRFVTSAGEEQTRVEDVSVAWYSDVGTLDGNRWDPGTETDGVLIVVVRDGRGGTDWATFPVTDE